MPSPSIPAVTTWASDANYPAGGNPWNAQPTKVAPSGGKQAEGLEPVEKPPAQWLNYLFNVWTRWLAFVSVLFDANGFYRRPPQTRHIPVHGGKAMSGTQALSNTAVGFTSVGKWRISLAMDEGERILSCQVVGMIQNASADTFQVRLVRKDVTLASAGNPIETVIAGPFQAGGVGGTAADGKWYAVDLGVLSEVVGSGHSDYYIDVDCNFYSVGSFITSALLSTDIPRP